MSEKALVGHIFVRLEPEFQDYVEVQNPENMVQLLEVLANFEETYSCKAIRGVTYEIGRQGNQRFESRDRFQKDDRRFKR
ncbi:hypothetical protein TNCV_3601331 [Trichonephila clavipes]|nr:hypothetical protein TNCV_3601331 [Trichonephila clavipes]